MVDIEEETTLENKIEKLQKQVEELEAGLTLKDDLEENERLYQYLLQQKKYELVEQRAKEKLADIEKIKECEIEIEKTENKLQEIEKIKNLKAQINSLPNNN
jgi:hypothetical protein